MPIYLNSDTPISRVYLGETLLPRLYYNDLIVYEVAETTLTQAWDNTGFMTPSWTLHPNYTAFVFMRGELGARGGEWTPRQPSQGDLRNILSAYNSIHHQDETGLTHISQTSNAPLTNVTTNWGVLRANAQDRVFTLATTSGSAGSAASRPYGGDPITRWLGTWRFGAGGRGGNGFSLMEGNAIRGNVHGSQGGPGKGIQMNTVGEHEIRITGGEPGTPGSPYPPIALPNDLSTTYPDFASTPFPATFLTSAPPMAALTLILKYEPGITS